MKSFLAKHFGEFVMLLTVLLGDIFITVLLINLLSIIDLITTIWRDIKDKGTKGFNPNIILKQFGFMCLWFLGLITGRIGDTLFKTENILTYSIAFVIGAYIVTSIVSNITKITGVPIQKTVAKFFKQRDE